MDASLCLRFVQYDKVRAWMLRFAQHDKSGGITPNAWIAMREICLKSGELI